MKVALKEASPVEGALADGSQDSFEATQVQATQVAEAAPEPPAANSLPLFDTAECQRELTDIMDKQEEAAREHEKDPLPSPALYVRSNACEDSGVSIA